MAPKYKAKIAFPHMGTVSYAWRAALRKLDKVRLFRLIQIKELYLLVRNMLLRQYVCLTN